MCTGALFGKKKFLSQVCIVSLFLALFYCVKEFIDLSKKNTFKLHIVFQVCKDQSFAIQWMLCMTRTMICPVYISNDKKRFHSL